MNLLKNNLKIFVFVVLILLCALIYLIAYKGSSWDGSSRFRYALVSKTGEVYVSLLVPSKSEVQVARLKPEFEIEAARGLGKWKVSSLLALGEQEKIGGDTLIRETLTQGFGAPIEGLWIQNSGQINRSNMLRGLFSGHGDLSFSTRIQIALFMLRSPINVWENDLDGRNIITLTAEPINDVSEGILTVVNKTSDKNKYLHELSRLIENLGGKILKVSDEKPEDGTCIVYGKSTFSKKLSSTLSCVYKDGGEDIQKIVLYEGFLKRF